MSAHSAFQSVFASITTPTTFVPQVVPHAHGKYGARGGSTARNVTITSGPSARAAFAYAGG